MRGIRREGHGIWRSLEHQESNRDIEHDRCPY
jgi:hypothetical protein